MTFKVFVDRVTNDDVLSDAYSWSSKGDPANLFWVVEDHLDGEPGGLVSCWRLNQVDHDITSYSRHMKNYLMRLLPVLPAKEADSIRSNISVHIADVQKNFGEFSFYRGSSNDPNGMIILKRTNIKTFGQYPLFLYFRYGFVEKSW